jgi:alpha-ketoglutarate-dependent taurine dioxygenase
MSHAVSEPAVVASLADWRGRDLHPSDWRYDLSAGEIAEVNHALDVLKASGKSPIEASSGDFPLPTLGAALRRQVAMVENGLGFRVVSGIPVGDKTEAEARLIAWGIGLHIGVALPQNAQGDAILDVRDTGQETTKTLRGNHSASEIHYHVDSADLVTLLCRRTAKSGGLSRIVSSLAIHNRMAMLHPDLVAEMYRPLPFYKLARQEGEVSPFFLCPVFGLRDGHFTSRYYRTRILAAAELPGAPRLTRRQRDALDVIHELASDPETYLEMAFKPGDLQIVSNHVIYHARTEFQDHGAPDLKRHLFRMWLAIANSRPLPRAFAQAYGNPEPGTLRGGYMGWDFPDTVGKYQARMARELGFQTA